MSIRQHGASTQQKDSVCYLSYWHIPHGCRYDLAEERKRYFNNREYAERVAKEYHNPPEMAFVVAITQGVES